MEVPTRMLFLLLGVVILSWKTVVGNERTLEML